MIHRDGNQWVFRVGKHVGATLEDVAKEDPSYLQWMFDKVAVSLSDEAFHALEDVMEAHDIEVP